MAENKEKYASKAYLNYEEAMEYLGMKRATLLNYVNDLDIQTHKFKRDRHRYLAIADVEFIARVRECPWLALQRPV